MAASTTRTTLDSDSYTAVATSAVDGVVQHMGGGMVRIHCGTTSPADGTSDYLLIGSMGDLPRRFTWADFTTGDIVYARRHDSDYDALITTISS